MDPICARSGTSSMRKRCGTSQGSLALLPDPAGVRFLCLFERRISTENYCAGLALGSYHIITTEQKGIVRAGHDATMYVLISLPLHDIA